MPPMNSSPFLVELTGAILVGRAKVAPAKRAMRARDANTGILAGLPDAKSGSGGVLQNRHAAGIAHVEAPGENRAAGFGGTRGRSVGVLHGDVRPQ